MRGLRVALAQVNVKVGALRENVGKIIQYIEKARRSGAQLVVFPELTISGYPPEDLLLKPAFIRACRGALEQLVRETKDIIAIVGFPEADSDLYNAAAVLTNGKLTGIYRKQYLPNYEVFDEERYFKPGCDNIVFETDHLRFGVSICEDIWYASGPHEAQAVLGDAQLLINLSASPYHRGKPKFREKMLSQRAGDSAAPVVFCNLVGGQDELVFDGGSMVFGPTGNLIARAKQFQEDLLMVDIHADLLGHRLKDPRRRKERSLNPHDKTIPRTIPVDFPFSIQRTASVKPRLEKPLPELDEIYEALVLGTRDYIQKNGFSKVLIGLSGGVDSALVACIAVDAVGAKNVIGVSMPSRYSSEHSKSDAARLAKSLDIQYRSVPIEPVYKAYMEALGPFFKKTKPNVAEENLQSRARGMILMALSNKFGWLVLTTGNKSEMSVGYTTLYGDMAGGYAVIKDVPKVLVYELSRYCNRKKSVIPRSILTKPPSAELRPDQKDSDSLPEYPVLDPILEDYIEHNASFSEIVAKGFKSEVVKKVMKLVDTAEYKRRQAPPGVRITPRGLGKDWRLPLTNGFHEWENAR